MRVVPSWCYWAPAAIVLSVYTPQPFNEPPAPPEAETLAPHIVRVAFRPLGPNPYLHNTAQDESVVEPLDLPHRLVVLPLRPLGRNPYLWTTAQDFDAPPPPVEPDPFVPRLVTHQFKELTILPHLGWHGAVEGVEQLDDVGGGFQVVVGWDGFALARATRFAHWSAAIGETEAAAEADTLAQFLVRTPFRAFGPNPYLRHGAQDESTVEPFDLPARLVVIPFKPLGHNPYLVRGATDDAVVVVPDTAAPWLVRVPYRGLGRNPYLWRTPEEQREPGEPGPFLVRLPLRPLGHSAYLWHSAQDLSAPIEADTWVPFLVRLDIRGRLQTVPAYVLVRHTPRSDVIAPSSATVGFVSAFRPEGFITRAEPFGFDSPTRPFGFVAPERPA